MTLSRRQILVGAAALAAGCEQTRTTGLPGVHWPRHGMGPRPEGGGYVPDSARGQGTPGDPINRDAWTHAGRGSNIDRMGGVNRITVHHEGSPEPVRFTGFHRTARHLEKVRQFHRNRGWADLGYHYVIDRAGRVWQGRPVRFQGAHVKDHNEHNVAVMVMGNFDLQEPSQAQLGTVAEMVRRLRQRYDVPIGSIYTHRELRPTRCPGANLQPQVEKMRRSGAFA